MISTHPIQNTRSHLLLLYYREMIAAHLEYLTCGVLQIFALKVPLIRNLA